MIGHDCTSCLKEVKHSGNNIFIDLNELVPSKRTDDEPSNQLEYETNRCSKILKALMSLKHNALVCFRRRRLNAYPFVSTLTQTPNFDGFLIKNGYFYFKQNGVFNKTNQFFIYYGSSGIISGKDFNLST